MIKSLKISSDMKKIFSISWPVMASIILQNLLSSVDMIFIGKLGKEQLAAAALSTSVCGVIFVLSSLISSGTVALVSRSFGEGNLALVKKYNSVSIVLSSVIGGALSIVSYIYTVPIIKLMFNPNKVVLDYSNKYLSILFLGTVLVFLNTTLRTTIQSLGDTKNPLIIFGISNVINAVLSPLFIFTLKMGIRGSAFAALISMIFSCIAINNLLIKKLYENRILKFIKSIRFDFSTSGKILKIGSWSCLQQVARPITGLFMFKLVFTVGKEAAVSAFGVGGNLFSYTFIILSGLSTGVAIMVGQSLGRRDYDGCDKIIKEGNKLALFNMILFIIPYIIFSEFFMRIFISDAEVIRIGAQYLRIVYLGLFFVIFPTIYGGVFQGAGDTFPPFISSFVANVILKLPLAYFLALLLKLGTNGVWASVALSIIIEAIIIFIFFKQNKWKMKVI
jgi:putative MATE family efflux protein